MAHGNDIFSQVQHTKLKHNIFDLTHDRKLSCQFGQLIPVNVMDIIPGDSITLSSSAMVRFAPTIAPVMHRCNVFLHHFFVPNRLVWPGWEAFITGGWDGNDNTLHPYYSMNLQNQAIGSLHDHLGLPIDSDVVAGAAGRQVSALPYAAYQMIWDEYYRDPNLLAPLEVELVDGSNAVNFAPYTALRKRAYQHDYLTSALPWTQRGPEAMMPLGSSADVVLKAGNTNEVIIVDTTGIQNPIAGQLQAGTVPVNGRLETTAATPVPGQIDPNGTLEADLSQATASSIIELRRALKLQEWLEKNARGGGRYIEQILVHFGVKSSDARLQRPEFIGGSKTPVKMSEVLQTSETTGTTPQGNMAGHGISVGGTQQFGYTAEEHGYIITIMSVLPETTYQQGIPRHFLRNDKFDYYWPSFAHIGEQAIFNDEVVVEGTILDGNNTWGYTPRYSEYKYLNNTVHGDFRTTLDFWHMGRKFTSLPPLDYPFMECDYQDHNRIFAVQGSDDHLWCQVINNIEARRPMPVFGNPKIT